MAYCTNCGNKINDGVKFCANCGQSVGIESSTKNERKTVYEGEIHKCPNCGAVLKSFVVNCPSCGLELRNTQCTSAVKEFTLKLEEIELNRESVSHPLLNKVKDIQYISKTDEQKINLIKNFSIPNTKEDILEFMILATTNIDVSIYGNIDTPTAGTRAVTNAWRSKMQQIYLKAKKVYGQDKDFFEIQELYNSCNANISKERKKKIFKSFLLFGWAPITLIIFAIISTNLENKEIKRLETIVRNVEISLEEKDYLSALNLADSIDYQRYDKDNEQIWDTKRADWVNKVLNEASNNGVQLTYTPSEDIDNTD